MIVNADSHSIRPSRPTWTHLAIAVKDVDATIAWYESFTHLTVLARHEDDAGRNVWLGDKSAKRNPFILVAGQFYAGKDPFSPAHHHPLGPFAHIGIELPSKDAVDDIAAKARDAGCLALGPLQMQKEIGYICFLKDPDGNTIEFSYDQGVLEVARRTWGAESD
jgi:lactoylglutathione lyase